MNKFKKLKDICVVSSSTIDDNYVGIKFLDDDIERTITILKEVK